MRSRYLPLLLTLASCASAESYEEQKVAEEKPIEQCIFERDIEPDEDVCELNPDINKLVKRYGLSLDDVISLGAIAMLESSGANIEEDGAVMRVAYNRANDPKKRFSGRTIRQVITACDWNCSESYKGQVRNALGNARKNKKYLLEAIDFLLGRGPASEGAYQCGCRSGLYHPETRKKLWGVTQDPSWATNKVRIGKGMFASKLNPCPEYPRKVLRK